MASAGKVAAIEAPGHLRQPLAELTQAFRQLLGEDLISVVLYGSAARNEHLPGRSDVNLLLVLKHVGAEQLRAASREVRRARKRIRLSPVFLSVSELAAYADTFAIESLDLQQQRVVLYGEDLCTAIQINPEHLRLQVRHELRGKLFRLRQSYLRDAADPRAVAQLMASSVGSFLSLAAVILRLRGKTPAPTRSELVTEIAGELGADEDLLRRLLSARSGETRIAKAEAHSLFGRYLAMVESVVGRADDPE